MYRRTRPHGLAAGIEVQLACPGEVRYFALEARHRQGAMFANGWAPDGGGGHRLQRAESNARPWTPGIRSCCLIRDAGRGQSAQAADPCNTVVRHRSDAAAAGGARPGSGVGGTSVPCRRRCQGQGDGRRFGGEWVGRGGSWSAGGDMDGGGLGGRVPSGDGDEPCRLVAGAAGRRSHHHLSPP